MLLIIPLGCTNDAAGRLDADAAPRILRVVERYRACVAANRPCMVLPSGGSDPAFAFNPTSTPHWEYVASAIVAAGVPEAHVVRPGLPALHTVDEAIMAREYVLRPPGNHPAVDEVLIVTSDFHAARARHLFGVAFGAHAACPVPARVEECASTLAADALAQRREHEKKALKTLRTEPFGAWAAFLQDHGLTACNKSLRWSRTLTPAVYDATALGADVIAPPAPRNARVSTVPADCGEMAVAGVAAQFAQVELR